MNSLTYIEPIEAPQSKAEHSPVFEITILEKVGGLLTKKISLSEDGRLKSDGSSCVMSSGTARRFPVNSLVNFAELLSRLTSSQAIALGSLRDDLPDLVEVVTKNKLDRPEDAARDGLISRTGDYIEYVAERSIR